MAAGAFEIIAKIGWWARGIVVEPMIRTSERTWLPFSSLLFVVAKKGNQCRVNPNDQINTLLLNVMF